VNAQVQVAVAAGNRLGEGSVWCERAQVLYWTDIHNCMLWRFAPADGALNSWPLPERLASFALCEMDGWLLLALASRLAFFHLERAELRPLHAVEPGLATRANDGACDRQGRFVFGTLHEPTDGGAPRAIGGFYRLNADLRLESLPLPKVAIANSIAFSPDGTRMYCCDSAQKRIWRCDYGDRLGAVTTFADLAALDGEPDGSCVDAEGAVWNAQWGAARLVRYAPDGRELAVFPLPTTQPTRPAFGGMDLRTVYVTSAFDGMDAAARANDPHAGDVFSLVPGVHGVIEPRFAGHPDAALGLAFT